MRVLIVHDVINLDAHLNPPLLRFYSGQAPVGEEKIRYPFARTVNEKNAE